MSYTTAQNPVQTGGISLGTRTEIITSAPLADLNSLAGPAYAARLKGDATSDLMAIICNAGLPPRLDSINSVRSIDHPSILKFIDSGVIHWPADDMRYFSFVFQRPLTPRMMNSIDETHPTMSEDAINHHFVTPMIGALAELSRTGVVHNAIRPTNIFWRIGGSSPPQLGECLSTPPGYGQSALFETLERSMCSPLGRGMGVHVDDCYTFGVVLALVVLGQNPLHGMDENAIIQLKNERGSFNALIGTRRLSGSHIELLRGLLTDDAKQRWTSADLEQWLNGRRLTPKNTDAGRRAGRALELAGKEYWQVRPLAAALASHMSDAARIIEDGTLNKWIRRALGDEARAEDIEESIKSLKSTGKTVNLEEQTVARTCIALDSVGPIRYRGIATMPSGIATMLIDAVVTGNNMQALSEIISSQLVTLWVEMQKDLKTNAVPLASQFERMRGMLERSNYGNGIERVVYELNPALQCLSPILRSQYVTNSKALMPALERLASSANRPREPMDRHIAAFLVARDRRSENAFEAMSSPENSPRRGLALLTLFSDIQSRHGPDALPNLAQWLMPLIEPSVQRYLGRSIKEKIQLQLRETAQRGDLSAMLRLVDDPKRIEYDRQEFTAARMLYLNIMKQIANIEHKLANREIVMNSTGKPMAASLSSFLAIILVMVAILRAVWQQLMM